MSQSQHSLSSGEMSDRMEQPGQGGTVKRRRREKFTQSLWIRHKATSFLCVGGLFDVMRPSGPPPPQLHLVNPSLSEVKRIESGLSFRRLEDDPRVFQEQQSQVLCQCHLQGQWVDDVRVMSQSPCLPVQRDRRNFGPPSLRLHCLCVCVLSVCVNCI